MRAETAYDNLNQPEREWFHTLRRELEREARDLAFKTLLEKMRLEAENPFKSDALRAMFKEECTFLEGEQKYYQEWTERHEQKQINNNYETF